MNRLLTHGLERGALADPNLALLQAEEAPQQHEEDGDQANAVGQAPHQVQAASAAQGGIVRA